MSLGTMTWTCLLLSVAAAQPDVWPTNQKAFQIPIHFDAQKRAEIKELVLWVSHDEGQSWNLAGRKAPSEDHFDYAVGEDGAYWFTMAILYQDGRQEPADVKAAPVGQRVLVDTTRPDVKLDVDRQGDEVRVGWAVTEKNPRPETLKLEYAATAEGPWTAIKINPGPTGHAAFTNPSAVVVRMQMQDIADNVGLGVKAVAAANGVAAAAAPPPPPFEGTPPLPGDPLATPATDQSQGVSKWTGRPPDAPPSGLSGLTHLPAPPLPPAPPPALPMNDVVGVPPPPAPSTALPPVLPPTAAPPPVAVAAKNPANQSVSYSPSPGVEPLPPPGAPLAGQDLTTPAHGDMPPLQIVNKRQVKLEFDVGKFGPSGLGGVDVYMTTDDGGTWQQAVVSPSAVTMQAADLHATGSVRASVTMQLMSEGVTYGYFVVAKSKAGLGRPAPRAGDPPQIRVELDATPPKAALVKIEANPTRPDTLTLWWIAEDKHLTGTPVTLEWSAQAGPDAQWNTIGPPEMENAGHYDWQPTPDVPPNVYLRMTVRDTAGNRSVAQTPKPQLIDLSVPEVTNIGLGSLGLTPAPH